MKRNVTTRTIGLLLSLLLLTAPSIAKADDTHSWNTLSAKFTLDQHWMLHAGSDQKFVDDMTEYGIWTLFAAPYYKAATNLLLGFEVRHQETKKNNLWVEENRFTPVVIYKKRSKPACITLRERVEYRTREAGNYWVSRNYIKAGLNTGPVSPYISNELFYDLNLEKFNENRLAAGLDIALSKKVLAGLYYMYKSNEKQGDWSGTNIVGTALTVKR